MFQYDYGKTIQNQEFQHTSFLNRPSDLVLAAVSVLESTYRIKGHKIRANIDAILEQTPMLEDEYARPGSESDRLYLASKVHPTECNGQQCSQLCGQEATDIIERRPRNPRKHPDPAIHHGSIASANQLMKDANTRDKLAQERGILCFEMEAAGIMNSLSCLVVRGICDYSDSHKTKEWQGYAAMTAAAYAKDLLQQIVPKRLEREKKMADTLQDSQSP